MKSAIPILLVVLLLGCVTAEAPADNGTKGIEKPEPAQVIEESTITEEEPVTIEENNTMENTSADVMATDSVSPEMPIFDFNKTTENGTLIIYFFHSPGCSACKATYPFMDELKDDHPEVIFIGYSLAEVNGTMAYREFARLNNLSSKQQMVPQVYVNGIILTDRFNIEDNLEGILENFSG